MSDALAITDQTDPLGASGADTFDPKSMPQPSEIDPMIGDAQTRMRQADQQLGRDRTQQGRGINALGESNQAYQAAAAGRKPAPDMPPAPDNGLAMESAGTWIAAATVFGAIAGAMTRRSSTNAMAAFTGALEGLKEGNKIKFDQSSKIWEQENKRIYQQWKMQDDSMQRILDDKKLDMDTKRFMIQQDSMKYRDDVMAKTAAQGDYVQMVTLKDRRADSIQKARQSFAQLQSTLQSRRDLQQYREDRLKQYSPEGMEQRRLATADAGALSSALNQAMRNRTAISGFEQTAKANIDKLIQLASQADATGVPFIDRYVRGGASAVGVQAARNFETQLSLVKPEVARIMTQPNLTGALTDNARAEANSIFKQGDSAANIYGVAKVLSADFANRKNSLDAEINQLRTEIKAKQQGEPLPQRDQTPWQPAPPGRSKSQGGGVIRYDAQGNPI